ncbi:PspC domain-containing protein [Streptococcus salivarius]
MKKELRRDPNNKIIAGVCSGIANILTLTLSLFASFGLQRFSYSEQAFFSTSFAGLLSQKKANGKLSLNIQKVIRT